MKCQDSSNSSLLRASFGRHAPALRLGLSRPVQSGRAKMKSGAKSAHQSLLIAMKYHGIDIPRDKIAAFCRENRIRRLALFGSILGEDFRPQSDVDVLVEFEPGARVGLRFFDMQDELSILLGRKVDLNTAGFLGKHIRDRVLSEAEVHYDAS
ncbi:MAG: nucleotidyltransferase family protein [Pirellulales bacterium]